MATTVTLKPNAIDISGSTSGTTTLQATAVAGTTTLTLPAATDTLVGKATTDTLTNKTLTTPSVSSPTISDGTANGVAYLNGSKVLTTGSALVFNSSNNLGLGVSPTSGWATFTNVFENQGGAIACSSTNNIRFFQNSYYNGSTYIYKTTEAASRYDQQQGAHAWFNAPSGTAGNVLTFTQAMTLDASGNLGVGTTSPSSRLEIVGVNPKLTINANDSVNGRNATLSLISGTSADPSGTCQIMYGASNSTTAGTLTFVEGDGTTERARIDSSGNLMVGQTSQSGTSNGISLTPAGAGTNSPAAYIAGAGTVSTAAGIAFYNTTASAYRFYVTYAGNINATNTTITAISDQRLKENIRDLDDGLEKVMALQPRKFDWKEGKGQDIKNARGFIAQEFQTVFPDMIQEWLDTPPEGEEPYKAINANLIPTLVKAIQELKAEFDAYKASHP
jgi:hypothetical protein